MRELAAGYCSGPQRHSWISQYPRLGVSANWRKYSALGAVSSRSTGLAPTPMDTMSTLSSLDPETVEHMESIPVHGKNWEALYPKGRADSYPE